MGVEGEIEYGRRKNMKLSTAENEIKYSVMPKIHQALVI